MLKLGFTTHLPAELLDIIIGYNEESVQDIRAASLVCKAWRSTALRYLFKFADFSLARDFERWHTILTEVPSASAFVREVQFSPGSRCDEKAMETLAQKYSHVEHYKQSRSYLNDVLPALSAANSEIDMVLPPDAPNLPAMPSVTKFTWNNRMAARRLGVRAFRPSTEDFLRCFPNVRELEVGGHFSTLADLFRVLRCFPHIRTVTLDNVAIRTPSLAGTRQILPTGALHQVEKLRAIFDEPCEINWLVDLILAEPKRLRRLEFTFEIPFSLAHFLHLLDLSSQSLEKLIIPPLKSDRRTHLSLPSVTTFPILHTVKIDTIHTGGSFDPVGALEWVTALLGCIPHAKALSCIHLCIYAEDPEDYDSIIGFDWKPFLTVVNAFPAMKVLLFEMLMETAFEDHEISCVEDKVRAKLAGCDKLVLKWKDENPEWSNAPDEAV